MPNPSGPIQAPYGDKWYLSDAVGVGNPTPSIEYPTDIITDTSSWAIGFAIYIDGAGNIIYPFEIEGSSLYIALTYEGGTTIGIYYETSIDNYSKLIDIPAGLHFVSMEYLNGDLTTKVDGLIADFTNGLSDFNIADINNVISEALDVPTPLSFIDGLSVGDSVNALPDEFNSDIQKYRFEQNPASMSIITKDEKFNKLEILRLDNIFQRALLDNEIRTMKWNIAANSLYERLKKFAVRDSYGNIPVYYFWDGTVGEFVGRKIKIIDVYAKPINNMDGYVELELQFIKFDF